MAERDCRGLTPLASAGSDPLDNRQNQTPMDAIADLRRRIDELDLALVALLNERARCALAIGQEKDRLGLPVYQPTREGDVLRNVRQANHGPLDDAAMTRLFERIIDEARRLERQAAAEHPPARGPAAGTGESE